MTLPKPAAGQGVGNQFPGTRGNRIALGEGKAAGAEILIPLPRGTS